jgi:Lar family restriction alleviation protein
MTALREELAPCPFCGGAPHFRERKSYRSNSYACWIRCIDCGTGQTRDYPDVNHAIGAWNKRTPSREIAAAIRKLGET